MHHLWQNLLRTVLTGTDRHPVPAEVLVALHLEVTDDAAATALRALPSAHLLRKAAMPFGDAPATGGAICPTDERLLCPPAAVKPLEAMLRFNTYPEVLPEYFELLHTRGWRLPPEILPETLDLLARKKRFSPVVWTALGPIGQWLAAQNPAWAGAGEAAAPAEVDWTLFKNQDDLDSPDSALVHALLDTTQFWPKSLLFGLLEYPLRKTLPRHWSPPKHLRLLLKQAALRCRPADIFDLAMPDREWPYAWHSELVQLRGVVQFRQKMRASFA